MVMPVQQACPKCGNDFMGSDCLGQPCDNCLVNAVNNGERAADILGVDFLAHRRCPKCQGIMIHTRLAGYRCNRGCQ